MANLRYPPTETGWRTSTLREPGDFRWRLYRGETYPAVVQVEVGGRYPFWTIKSTFGGSDGEQLIFFVGAFGRGFSLHLAHLPIPRWLTHTLVKVDCWGAPLPKNEWWPMPRERKTGVCLYLCEGNVPVSADHHLQFSIWDGDGWHSDQPWWQSFSLHPLDWFFGELVYSKTELMTEARSVVINGTEHQLEVTIYRATWKRPRWPGRLTVDRASVEISPGVPRRDKPDRDWQSISFALGADGRVFADPVEEAVAHVKELA